MLAPATTFPDFYQAIHGYPPFPWQARLAERVVQTDEWPTEVGVPTGLGKTACLDIAVWWLASQADREPVRRSAPTRIWWVVNRRLLVDSTAEHAEQLARALEDPELAGVAGKDSEIVAEVAERLRRLSADPTAPPLDVIRLRGGVASRTPTDPSRPTVLLCTLPMYGSRLLFRGYGSTLRPIDAAMAGTDSLVLLDEAHLAPHLRTLMAALAECTPAAEAVLGEARSGARVTSLTATGDPDGERLWPRATDREALDVPIAEVREALQVDEELRRLAPDGVTVEVIRAADLRPGDQVVLRADRGLLDHFGWNPTASEPVVDASLAGQGLPLNAKATQRLCGAALGQQITIALGNDEDDAVDQSARDEAVSLILSELRSVETPAGWDSAEWFEFTGALSPPVEEPRLEVPRLNVKTPERQQPSADLGSDFDEMSLSAGAAGLIDHGRAVGAQARLIADRIGLRYDLAEVVQLAGAMHDIGKADERFQRWLDPDRQRGVLLAKPDTPRHRWEATRAAAGWPRGGRHEDLSARLVCAWLEQNPSWGGAEHLDLLLHLVISHHGKGRPLVAPVLDGTASEVSAVVEGVSVAAPADLAIVDWFQPGRFRRLNDRFGPWGLGLLESIVRLADHAVSAGTDTSRDAPR